MASAVNAIHIKLGNDPISNTGQIISLLPINNPSNGTSIIQTSISGGKEIFGSKISPYVSNPVFFEKNNKLIPLFNKGYIAVNDVIIIQILEPDPLPTQIILENVFNGNIYAYYKNQDKPELIAKVVKPVMGIGRFLGAEFTDVGRIRANHPGVIDISTSPLGYIGGFQIIPAKHGMSTEMYKAITHSQWMVVAGLTNSNDDLPGSAPLFMNYIKPSFNNENHNENFLVQCFKNGKWQTLPSKRLTSNDPLTEEDNFFLKDIKAFRILFPQER